MAKNVMLVDANSLLYRAFFALPPLENSAGQPTGAIYGFINMLLKLETDYPSQLVVAAFDVSGPTRRQQRYSQYKAQRPKMPSELRGQFDLAKEVLTALGIPQVGCQGYEADDIVATLARAAQSDGWVVRIVSGDKDVLQLVDTSVKIILTQKGISKIKEYDVRGIKEQYGVAPPQLVDVKGLMGDPSDNIPGVPGIGEKTALKLIIRYGSLEAVYENLEDLKGKLRENLERYREQARLSKELAQIDSQVPLDSGWPLKAPPRHREAILQLFKRLEFNTLLDRLQLGNDRAPVDIVTVGKPDELNALFERPRLGMLLAAPDVVALGADNNSYICAGDLSRRALEKVAAYIADPGHQLVTDDVKALCRLALENQWDIACQVHGCQLAGYLLRPGSNLSIPRLVRAWTETGLEPAEDQEDWERNAAHVALLPLLWDNLFLQMEKAGVMELYQEIELPLAQVLARMELMGVALDIEELAEIGSQVAEQIQALQEKIWALAGHEFNINSPRQLSTVLFEELALPSQRRTKTGQSTDIGVLEALAGQHEIIPLIIDYRQLIKLQTTYIEGLKQVWDSASGRVYTTFNQTVTATGRLSSTDPNLQNIPIRLEAGRKIRRAFVPGGGYNLLLAADYSQIELRVLADVAQDCALIAAFSQGEDIHARTAAEIFALSLDAVTPRQRRAAKAVNFGLVYGQTDFGLARALGITRQEAKEYIETYFSRYPGVKQYMQDIVKQARERGYVTTRFGRRRYLPEINSRNFQRRSFAERTAINTPIQGGAADIIKLAMIEVARQLEAHGMVSRLLLQVHDELVLETTEDEAEELTGLVRRAMEKVVRLAVPLVVDIKQGGDWYNMEAVKL